MAHGYLVNTNGWTIEGWFWRPSPPSTNPAALFTQYTQVTGISWTHGGAIGRQLWFGLAATTGAFTLNIGDEGGGNNLSWVDPSPAGYEGDSAWHFWALRLGTDKKTLTVYLDADEYATQVLPTPLSWNPGRITLAGSFNPQHGDQGKDAWDHRVAYYALFNKALTTNRLFEHYTAGAGGTVYYGDDEVQRLTRIFDWADVPKESRFMEDPKTTLQGIQVANTNALTQAQETANSAGGYVFANGQAGMIYHNRAHRYNRWAGMVLGEQAGAAPEVGITFTGNSAYIFNDVRGSRPFGNTVRLEDKSSQDANGRKVYSFELKVTDPDELKNAVTWLLARYAEDRVRVSNVTFSCTTSILLKDLAYSRVEIGDLLIIDQMPDPAPSATMEFIIEGMSVRANFLDKTWEVTLALSPNDVNTVFEIGESPLGGLAYVGL